MKKAIFSALALFSATAASAGSIVYTAPDVIAIEEPARMGGSGIWLIPLIIVAVLALALTQEEDEDVIVLNGQTF